jgi:hypothetical protein
MKFLCVPCDQPMKLMETRPPERGSLTVVYSCPACGYEMAMLTNPHETQMVTSLGVRIGPAESAAAPAATRATDTAPAETSGSKCPFAAMVAGTAPERAAAPGDGVRWSPGAAARLEAIPSFVRPMARAGIEQYAVERGMTEVTESLLDEARSHFGM